MSQHCTLTGRFIRRTCVALTFSMLLPQTLLAIDEFSYDLRLIQALADIGMQDYASLQVDRMLAVYPAKADRIHIAQARVFFQNNQRSQGNQVLDKVKPDSPFYAESRLLIGTMAAQRGDFVTAKDAFKQYFGKYSQPPTDSPEDVLPFREAVQLYAQVFIREGNAGEAAKVLDYLKNLKGEFKMTPGQVEYLKGQTILTAQDRRDEEGQAVQKEMVLATIQSLTKLQLEEGVGNYPLLVGTTIEMAHGYILLDQPDKAIETLRSVSEILVAVDKQVSPRESPLASAFFYYGRAMKGKAFEDFRKGNKDAAQEHLLAASKRFLKIMQDYDKSNFADPAMIEFGKIKELLKREFNTEIEGPEVAGSAMMVALQEANRLFDARDWRGAAPLYLKALRAGRTTGKAPEIGMRLCYCYGQLQNFLEAQAVAAFLAEIYPDATETADTQLQLGALIFQTSQATANPAEKELLIEEAMTVWDQFVTVAPQHRSAADIAFVVAENEYRKAEEVARKSAEVKDRAEREELKDQARHLYQHAIPKYQRMIDVFGYTPKGIRARYKLGWIYYSLENHQKQAAEVFSQYSVLESDPQHLEDRLQAKFRAAEQLMFSPEPEPSIPQFTELLSWLQPGNPQGFDAGSEKARAFREDASSYLGWAYDLSAEALRPALQEIVGKKAAYQDSIKEQKNIVVAAEAQAAEAAGIEQRAKEDFAEREKQIKGGLPQPEAQALAEKLPEAELAKWSEAERKIELPKRQQEARSLADRYRNQFLLDLAGEKEQLEAEKTQVFEQHGTLKRDTESLAVLLTGRNEKFKNMNEDWGRLNEDLDRLNGDIENAKETLDAMEETRNSLRTQLTEAMELFETGTAEEKRQARQAGLTTQAALRKNAVEIEEATADLEVAASQDKLERIRRFTQRKHELELQLAETRQFITQKTQELQLKEKQAAVREARLQGITRRQTQIDLTIELLRVTAEQRSAAAAEKGWGQVQNDALQAAEAVLQKTMEQTAFMQGLAQQAIADAKAMMDEANARMIELDQQRQPLADKFRAMKESAKTQFEQFLEAYPKSRHVPENMSRLGSILIDFEQYAVAAQYLNKLAQDYPNHAAVKHALFNLGKAQYETGKVAEAKEAFLRQLKEIQELATATLNYIGRAMGEAGFPEISLQVNEELLRRGKDVEHKDFEMLSGKTRENLLFRAGQAAFDAGKMEKAISYMLELINLNQNSAHFFKAKIVLAQAKRLKQPPDLAGAILDLSDVRSRAQDETVVNQTMVEMAKTFMAQDSADGMRKAAGQLSQIVLVSDGETLILAAENQPENQPFIEEAFFLAAQCYAQLGDNDSRDTLVKSYRARFPGGKFSEQISNLPPAKYAGNPVPVANVTTE